MKLFFDLDDVLANLSEGYYLETGIRIDHPTLNSKTRWDKISKESEFWYKIPVHSSGLILLEHISNNLSIFYSNIDSFHILSARQNNFPTCDEEKTRWVIDRIISRFSFISVDNIHIVARHEKKNFAVNVDGTQNILIDDYHKNINEWEKSKGIGIKHDPNNVNQTILDLLNVMIKYA